MTYLKILVSEMLVSSLEHEARYRPLFTMRSIIKIKKKHLGVPHSILPKRRMEEQLRDPPQTNSILRKGIKPFRTIAFSIWLYINCLLSYSWRNLLYQYVLLLYNRY